jgi:alanyl-tRNA synthetase
MSPGVPTEKLYLTDPYTVSFEASVLSCTPRSGGGYAVVLNRTFFYPESGGQLSDRGTIAGRAVVNVWEDESGSVFHALEEPVEPGVVQGEVDAARRFDHMQQHTGQHILSRALIEAGGLHTVSFHMGDDACSIDVEGPEPSQETLDAAEALANTVVWEDRPVTVRTMPRDEVVERSLRKSIPEGVTEVRLVEVEGFDVIGCCGTHVRRAGELGLIKVLKHEKTKGAYRVYFKVGRRAFADYREKHETVRQLAMRFTTSVSNLTEKVEKLQADHQRIRKQFQGQSGWRSKRPENCSRPRE